MKVLVESYGCTLNRGEGEEFSQAVLESGYGLTDDVDDADAAVLFTCGVIETTERRMLKRIRELAGFEKLLICGCLGNIAPEKILAVAPKAILIQPTDNPAALEHLGANVRTASAVTYIQSPIGILPVASGCLGDCAYCVTKAARGELKSRPVNDIVDRAKHLIGRGTVELQVCAQDTVIYGRDISSDLNTLVSALTKLDGEFMIRIGMMNPRYAKHVLDDIIELYTHDKVFRFLHLPVQSGSDAVLDRMDRGYAAEDFVRILDTFRGAYPDSTISTDIIVGFPGETDEDHDETLELIRKTVPDIVNVTRFSTRPNTPAAEMGEQVVSRIAKERSRSLTDLRFDILSKKFDGRVGDTVKALATERRQPGTTFLRTRDYWPIVIKNHMPLGHWYEVTVIGHEKTHLRGEVYPNH
ncbi:MAG: hypothetical protein AYK23_00195 [Candidatus Proteinoplasmatales archaeon SG8-5]|nr:MAG: hypothetical protein AYK23_00195 [Candidatus Proteinoplasmatales archaeon SG8-5]